ncbi:MAG: methyltransferase domain-containing protein [Chloroflexi bacterium]|nr:methyltransferase domain-containing protein [Chloroflexota bacterium]
MTDLAALEADAVKACCANVYASDWAKLLLGDSFHPGGLALTTRLGQLLGLDASSTVLDVATGRGASAIHLAQMIGCRVIGVDYSAENIEMAREAARAGGVEHLVSFRQGDAEQLPIGDGEVDAAICECAFCTFPDKPTAARELARVIRPGGRLGLSDLTRRGELPLELSGLVAWVACLGDARPVEEYAGLLEAAGFEPPIVERHDDALLDMARLVRRRLMAVDLLAKLGQVALPTGSLTDAQRMAEAAHIAVEAGQFGYVLLVTSLPPGASSPPAESTAQTEMGGAS